MVEAIRLFLIIAGPGIVVTVADNDAGGITTYAATGAPMLMETNRYTGNSKFKLSMPLSRESERPLPSRV